jgi:hypothetical protein
VSFAEPPESRGNQGDEVIELTGDGSFDVSSGRKPTPIMEDAVDPALDEDQGKYSLSEKEEPHDEALGVDDQADSPEMQEAAELPPPRECVQAEIRFTPRVFPTPSRESKAAEEEDWLLKNRKHIKKHQGLNRTSEYDISETDRTYHASRES